MSPSRADNMVNFGPIVSQICWQVSGTPANFNWFCVFVALLPGTLVVGVSQPLRRLTEGATYIRQGGMLARWRAVDENVEERDEKEERDCIINVHRITRVMNIRLRPARYQ